MTSPASPTSRSWRSPIRPSDSKTDSIRPPDHHRCLLVTTRTDIRDDRLTLATRIFTTSNRSTHLPSRGRSASCTTSGDDQVRHAMLGSVDLPPGRITSDHRSTASLRRPQRSPRASARDPNCLSTYATDVGHPPTSAPHPCRYAPGSSTAATSAAAVKVRTTVTAGQQTTPGSTPCRSARRRRRHRRPRRLPGLRPQRG